MAEEVDWSGVPAHLLDMIIDRLTYSNSDYSHFGCVCTSWRSIYHHNFNRLSPRQLPVLMVPFSSEDEEDTEKEKNNKRSFYDLTSGKLHDFRLSVPANRFVVGSSYGWLVTAVMDDDKFPVRMINPFLSVNNEIELPSQLSFPREENEEEPDFYWYISGAVLSSNPTTSDDYVVMATYGGCDKLAFCKPGDTRWTDVEIESSSFTDVIYHKEKFYAVQCNGAVFAFDVSDPKHQVCKQIASTPSRGLYLSAQPYIVESSGALFQVVRLLYNTSETTYTTIAFHVFKLLDYDLNVGKWEGEEEPKWMKVSTLDGCAFFVGFKVSMSLQVGPAASDFPAGYRPNCIYFIDDYLPGCVLDDLVGPHDIGVYDVVEDSIKPLYYRRDSNVAPIWPNPVWVEPTLCRTSSSL